MSNNGNEDVKEKEKNNFKDIEKNIFGIFSNLEDDYKNILKDIRTNKKDIRRRSFNFLEPKIYNISNDIITSKETKNNSVSNQFIKKNPAFNYSSNNKKKGYPKIKEYPFKSNIRIQKKNENKEFFEENNNPKLEENCRDSKLEEKK